MTGKNERMRAGASVEREAIQVLRVIARLRRRNGQRRERSSR